MGLSGDGARRTLAGMTWNKESVPYWNKEGLTGRDFGREFVEDRRPRILLGGVSISD